jgi:hypothetical protein
VVGVTGRQGHIYVLKLTRPLNAKPAIRSRSDERVRDESGEVQRLQGRCPLQRMLLLHPRIQIATSHAKGAELGARAPAHPALTDRDSVAQHGEEMKQRIIASICVVIIVIGSWSIGREYSRLRAATSVDCKFYLERFEAKFPFADNVFSGCADCYHHDEAIIFCTGR